MAASLVVVVAAAASVLGSADVGGWPMYGATATHSRCQPRFVINSTRITPLWKFKTQNFVYGAPCVGSDETVYASSWDGALYAINPDSTLQWKYTVRRNEKIWSSPALGATTAGAGGAAPVVVYVGGNQSLLAITTAPPNTSAPAAAGGAATPMLKWAVKTTAPIFASPTVDHASGNVYIGGLDGTFLAVEPTAGKVLWTFKAGGPIYASAALYAGTVYFATLLPGQAFALDAASGTKRWSASTAAASASRTLPSLFPLPPARLDAVRTYTSSPSTSPDGRVVYLADQEGQFVALNASTGAVVCKTTATFGTVRAYAELYLRPT